MVLVLGVLLLVVLWLVSSRLEKNAFVRWMSDDTSHQPTNPWVDITKIEDDYSFGYATGLTHPVWLSFSITDSSVYDPQKQITHADVQVESRQDSGTFINIIPGNNIIYNNENINPLAMFCLNPGMEYLWEEAVTQAKKWSAEFGKLHVVSGIHMVEEKVPVEGFCPDSIFIALLSLEDDIIGSLAFIMPNSADTLALPQYAVSVDEVETWSGLELFSDLLKSEEEKIVENNAKPLNWGYDLNAWEHRKQAVKQLINE